MHANLPKTLACIAGTLVCFFVQCAVLCRESRECDLSLPAVVMGGWDK